MNMLVEGMEVDGGERKMGRLMIVKAAGVLDLFSLERPEWGVTEIARELGIPKSTACEILISLTDQRLLQRSSRGRYRLGWKLFELGQTLLYTTEFRTEARKAMKELVEQWNETTHLAVLEGVEAVYLEKIQPRPAVRILISHTGVRLPANCTGVGKVLLANENWEDIEVQLKEKELAAFTPDTITDPDTLAEELETIRERGYSYDMEEATVGLCCVAAPIWDHSGKIVAAMSLSVPAYRFGDKKEALTAAILEATRHVSEASGGSAERQYAYKVKEENTVLARRDFQSV